MFGVTQPISTLYMCTCRTCSLAIEGSLTTPLSPPNTLSPQFSLWYDLKEYIEHSHTESIANWDFPLSKRVCVCSCTLYTRFKRQVALLHSGLHYHPTRWLAHPVTHYNITLFCTEVHVYNSESCNIDSICWPTHPHPQYDSGIYFSILLKKARANA